MSSNGRCFDIGNTVSAALRRYQQSGQAMSGSTDPMSAGNGCIMRLAPIPMFYQSNLEETLHFSGESSRTTHGAPEAVEAVGLGADAAVGLLRLAHAERLDVAVIEERDRDGFPAVIEVVRFAVDV